MTRPLRTLGLSLLIVAFACYVAGTAGFAAATADRAIAADEVDDDSAYVGYDSPDAVRIEYRTNETTNGTTNETTTNETTTTETDGDADATKTVTLVTVTNRFGSTADLGSIDVDAPDGLDVTVTSAPESLAPGESGDIVAELDCEEAFADGRLSVSFDLDGRTASAEISGDEPDRTVSVTCDEQS